MFEFNSTSRSLSRRGRPRNDRWLFQIQHPQYFSHLIIRRCFRVVPVLIGPSIPRSEREDTKERYARAILTLFCPWRNVLDICEIDQLWSDALKIRRSTFSIMSDKVINNIQLLNECKKDRDQDLFQLVNQPLSSQKINDSSSYIDADIDDVEQILALLDETTDLDTNLLNDDAIQFSGAREQMKRQYLNSALANIIKAQRFSHINNSKPFSDSIFSNRTILTTEVNQDNVLMYEANPEDIERIRVWQYNLKIQKEEKMRRILLYGMERYMEDQGMLKSLFLFHNIFIQFINTINLRDKY